MIGGDIGFLDEDRPEDSNVLRQRGVGKTTSASTTALHFTSGGYRLS